MLLTIGTRLGNYEIVATLGAGGMGEVYRARDTKLGRDVALKVLPAEVSAKSDRLARFEREARTVASLTHPNIVVLHSMEEEGGVHFLTMELVDGEGLDRHVTADGLPAARVVDTGIALADALTAAHERGVIHRDLKPANVMLTRDGRVKVLDFGLAKLAEAASSASLSHAATMAAPLSEPGLVVGTVPYMAPEQIRGEAVDARTDVFALGILLYELAAGRRPFGGATSAEISSAILRDVPEPITRLRAEMPIDLDRIVSRCLEKNLRERFQTALDVANELRRLRKHLEGGHLLPAGPGTGQVVSIAVLPFVNRSASADDEYFSDGLADELLNVLAKIKGFRVIARTSSFQFKGTKEDIAAIGRKLGVATVIEGSVRKAGPRVRISVQLIKVADSSNLWSESYDRSLDDIFAVQDDIAQSVVKELRTTLLGESADSDAVARAKADVGAVVRGHGQNAEAHRLYLQGKYFVDRFTAADVARGIEYLEQALALDAAHAAAWSTLARAHTLCGGFGFEPLLEAFRLARAATTRAMALAPDLAEAHATMATIQRYHDWDWEGAEQSCKRALELAAENAEALHSYGWLCYHVGRFADAEALLMRSIDRDPLTVDGYVGLGMLYRSMGRLADAEHWLRKAIELVPQAVHTRHVLAFLLAETRRDEEAVAMAMEEPALWARLTALAYVHHKAGRSVESDAPLHELETHHSGHSAVQIAQIHASRSELDAAFHWLERAFEQRDPGMAWTKFDPCFAALRDDPRWAAMMSRLGLADSPLTSPQAPSQGR